ncbi:hypothetical protein [Burkholderia cepacia]|uniref:hypothetical protein n=1 Tax=Burkholderia cepacia TaxID=292 RepID=UPI0026DFDE79|nr:hypothetical protein [Burkholderia cepacia]MDO5946743.1 hypothetical protein [Burkholderia cepacia]
MTKQIVRFADLDETLRSQILKDQTVAGSVVAGSFTKHAVVEIADDGGLTIFNSAEAQQKASDPVKLTKPKL